MGLENLSVGARSALLEVGRMAYGSREGEAGGKGHIGLLTCNGKTRIIKFDTHGGSTGGTEAAESGDKLRVLLETISRSADLSVETLDEIRKALGLASSGGSEGAKPTGSLERVVAAKVVELIGGKEIWREVKATFNKDVYKSKFDTSFESVRALAEEASGDMNNVKSIEDVQLKVHTYSDNCIKAMKKAFNENFSVINGVHADKERSLLGKVLDSAPLSCCESKGSYKAVSKGDLDRAYLKMLVNVVIANNDKIGMRSLPTLNQSPAWKERRRLSTVELLNAQNNVKLFKWCEENAVKFGFADADTLKATVLKNLFEQDLCTEDGYGEKITEKFTANGTEVEVIGTRGGIDALRAALGQEKTPKERALENIKKFVALAAENGNRADFYLKRSEDGKSLTSAGSRNIFRGSTSRAENNAVREWLRQNIETYYGDANKIPEQVRQAMTNFAGGGNPLSADRVAKIWGAMDVDRGLSPYR